jgi:hypothetical protein
MCALYCRISRMHATAYNEHDSELERAVTGPASEEELSQLLELAETSYEARERSAVIAITFAGMALEAFFFDYAADALGDNFVEEHLDKQMDLKSKFLIYPLLVCGKQPDKGGAAYDSLRQLVTLRNDLVHFKSKSFDIVPDLSKAADFHDKLNSRLRDGVENATRCIRLVMAELDKLHDRGKYFSNLMESRAEG